MTIRHLVFLFGITFSVCVGASEYKPGSSPKCEERMKRVGAIPGHKDCEVKCGTGGFNMGDFYLGCLEKENITEINIPKASQNKVPRTFDEVLEGIEKIEIPEVGPVLEGGKELSEEDFAKGKAIFQEIFDTYVNEQVYVSKEEMEKKFGSIRFSSEGFKRGDRLIRHGMATYILSNKMFIGMQEDKVKTMLGKMSGYYFNDAITTYMLDPKPWENKEKVLQLVFFSDENKIIQEVRVHNQTDSLE